MEHSIYIGLVNNAALLLALCLFYDLLRFLPRNLPVFFEKIFTGILLSLIGIAIMMTPVLFGNGVVFDTRSVLLCISGFFFGTIPTLIAILITCAVRICTGGIGVWTGLAVIVTSGGIGIGWRLLRNRQPRAGSDPDIVELYLLGVVVHVAMLAWMLTLPEHLSAEVLSGMSLPVMVIFPVATALLGHVIVRIEQREAQARALRESEEKFRTLFQHHSAIKLLIEPGTGRIVEANAAAEKFYGWPGDILKKKRIQEINTLSSSQVQAEMKKAESLERTHFEFRHRLADGSCKDVDVYSSQVQIKGKVFLHSIIHDITDRKTAEKEKERLQAQLIQAQNWESVGRLAGGVAHDFNNMLNVILGNVELIMESVDPKHPAQEDLKQIHDAATRSVDMTRQLLAFARKQAISPHLLDLNDLIENMLKILQRLIGENIHLAWHPSEQVRPVWMDPSQMDQVLANLCINARDAIRDVGKITIETGIKVFDDQYCRDNAGFIPGRFSLLAVSDNGCGMDQNTLSHLFEPFFTTKRPGQGTGLGLATVYGIVKQNKGFIKVYSEPGTGTTFKIYLPAHTLKAEPVTLQDTTQTPMSKGETVLLVEDEKTISTLIVKILIQLGYRVLEANTPNRAMELADAHTDSVHLLMTDVVMPEMNGRDLADQISARHPGIKVLFMSGYTHNVIAHHGVLDKEIHFLQKPFSKQELAIKIRDVLESS